MAALALLGMAASIMVAFLASRVGASAGRDLRSVDYDAPTPEALEKFLQGIGGYKIAEENLYRFEAGVFNQACEEFYELLFTRRVCARSGNWELTICFYYPPEAQLEEYSDLVCADDPDSFVKEVLASEALQTVLTRYKPMRVRVHAEQV